MSCVWQGREGKEFPMSALKRNTLHSAPSHLAADTWSIRGPLEVIALLMVAACAFILLLPDPYTAPDPMGLLGG